MIRLENLRSEFQRPKYDIKFTLRESPDEISVSREIGERMKGTTKPLISMVIPTRERAETLLFALKTVLNQSSRNFEVIVSDNFSQDGTRSVVQDFADARLRYLNTGRRLSMCDNWEFALGHAQGEYVIFIGDDDAVMPGALDRLEELIRISSSPVYCWPLHEYTWPIDGKRAEVMHLASTKPAREVNLEELAKFVVSTGGWKHYEIPCMYHSAVARYIPDSIRATTGRVFHSTNPDVFMSLAVPVFAKTAIDIGFAVTLTGRSAKSNGGVSSAKNGLENHARCIGEYGDYKIHPTLFPEVPVAANLIPDSVLVAMEKFPQFYGGMKFNYSAMWAYMCRMQPVFKYDLRKWAIIRRRREICRYHPFSVSRFLPYLAIQEAAAFRRALLRKTVKRRFDPCPDNISDFVKELASLQSTTVQTGRRQT